MASSLSSSLPYTGTPAYTEACVSEELLMTEDVLLHLICSPKACKTVTKWSESKVVTSGDFKASYFVPPLLISGCYNARSYRFEVQKEQTSEGTQYLFQCYFNQGSAMSPKPCFVQSSTLYLMVDSVWTKRATMFVNYR